MQIVQWSDWDNSTVSEVPRRILAPPPEIRDLYNGVYTARSKIVHGGRRFEVDEPFLGIEVQGDLMPLVAWGAAKRGVVNWLCAQ